MGDVDITLGMDCLIEDYATIFFKPQRKNTSSLHGISMESRIPVFQPYKQGRRGEKKEFQAFLAYLNAKVGTEKTIEDLEMVHEFCDVLPENLSRLPPNRQVILTIDLEPGSTPVS